MAAKKKATPQRPRVTDIPDSKAAAATSAAMHLYTDDTWARAYYDRTDLHYFERSLFAPRKK